GIRDGHVTGVQTCALPIFCAAEFVWSVPNVRCPVSESALRIAETGHLTFGTLHTNSAAQTINRIIDMFPAHQQSQIRTQLSLVRSEERRAGKASSRQICGA